MRKLKHPKYYAIEGYQILARLSDDDVAKALGMSKRTYLDKRNGYGDFNIAQGDKLSELLQQPRDVLFLT